MNINNVGELKAVWKDIEIIYVLCTYSPNDSHYFKTTKREIKEQVFHLHDFTKLNASVTVNKKVELWIG